MLPWATPYLFLESVTMIFSSGHDIDDFEVQLSILWPAWKEVWGSRATWGADAINRGRYIWRKQATCRIILADVFSCSTHLAWSTPRRGRIGTTISSRWSRIPHMRHDNVSAWIWRRWKLTINRSTDHRATLAMWDFFFAFVCLVLVQTYCLVYYLEDTGLAFDFFKPLSNRTKLDFSRHSVFHMNATQWCIMDIKTLLR